MSCAVAWEGYLPLLQALVQQQSRTRLTQSLMDNAITGGHMEVIKWLHSQGCPMYVNTYESAVIMGHVHVLEWLCQYDQGTIIDFDYSTLTAAYRGHFELLKWLYARCPRINFNRCIEAASRRGHIAIAQWLLAIQPQSE
jgi:hypothetical protein